MRFTLRPFPERPPESSVDASVMNSSVSFFWSPGFASQAIRQGWTQIQRAASHVSDLQHLRPFKGISMVQHPLNLWKINDSAATALQSMVPQKKYGHQNPSKSPSDHLSHPWALRAAHHSSAWPSALWTWRRASTAQPHWASGTWGPRWQAHTFTLFIYSRSRNALGCQIDEFSIVLCHHMPSKSVSFHICKSCSEVSENEEMPCPQGIQDRDSRCHSSHLRQLAWHLSCQFIIVYHRLSSLFIILESCRVALCTSTKFQWSQAPPQVLALCDDTSSATSKAAVLPVLPSGPTSPKASEVKLNEWMPSPSLK